MNRSIKISQSITRSPFCLLGLIGFTVFASPVAAQVFDPGPSDPALFDYVINVPPTPDLGGDYVCGVGFQINLFDNGSIAPALQPLAGCEVNISGGTVGDTLIAFSGSEVNISGGYIGDGFKAISGSAINISGRDFALDGAPLLDMLIENEAFTIADRDVTLTGFLDDGSQFSFDLNSEFVSLVFEEDFFSPDATLTVTLVPQGVFLGDVNNSGDLNFLDIVPFIEVLQTVNSQIPPRPYLLVEAADINLDGEVSFSDIGPFIALLSQ